MDRRKRCGAGVLMTWIVILGLAGSAPAADSPAAPDSQTQDARINLVLRDIINRGADLYNAGDHSACYRLWEGSLLTLRPLVDQHPDWQKAIDAALASANNEPSVAKKAFVLREALNLIRSDIKTKEPGATTTPTPPTPQTQTPATGKGATLWERLGGEPNVRKIVDDLTGLAANDPKVDFFRGGKYKDVDVAHLKKAIIDLISSATGGPFKYTGKSMKEAHKGMGITDAQFDAFAQDVRKALETNGVKPPDVIAVMTLLGGMRNDVVEPIRPSGK
jgi:hemoglobin